MPSVVRPAAAATVTPALALALLLAGPPARAQERPAPPRWEIGAFAVGLSQQAYPGADRQVNRALALPFFVYRGEYLRADQDTAGLRAVKTETFELDLSFSGALGGRADEVPARQGMPRLGTLVEFGPRMRWTLARSPVWGRLRLELPLRGVFDLRDDLASRGLVAEPEATLERRHASGLTSSLSVGALLGDRRLADTFYGVAPAYATATRPAYAARAGLIGWRLQAAFTQPLSPDWRVFGFVRVDSVAGAANQDSPLVRRTTGATAGLGVAWTWMRSRQTGSD